MVQKIHIGQVWEAVGSFVCEVVDIQRGVAILMCIDSKRKELVGKEYHLDCKILSEKPRIGGGWNLVQPAEKSS